MGVTRSLEYAEAEGGAVRTVGSDVREREREIEGAEEEDEDERRGRDDIADEGEKVDEPGEEEKRRGVTHTGRSRRPVTGGTPAHPRRGSRSREIYAVISGSAAAISALGLGDIAGSSR